MLKSVAKVVLISVCLFASFSSFAWVCDATNARVSGTWVGRSAYLGEAKQLALSFCRQATSTRNPGTCHIERCNP